ncbi:unnamed protein product [Discosporangium mesarthrocarpum]
MELSLYCLPHDLKRLDMYSRNLVDYHLITDLLPLLCRLFFLGRMPDVHMSHLQEAILIGMGVQHRSVTDLSKELQLPDNQVLALFNKAVRKLSNSLKSVAERAAEVELESSGEASKRKEAARTAEEMSQLPTTMDQDLKAGAAEAMKKLEGRKEEMLGSLDLTQYEVKGTEEEWEAAVTKAKKGGLNMVSIKGKAKPVSGASSQGQAEEEPGEGGNGKGKGKGGKAKKKHRGSEGRAPDSGQKNKKFKKG